ncbi:hypothetical protein TNCT_307861, partial [Trichonephila clavata]
TLSLATKTPRHEHYWIWDALQRAVQKRSPPPPTPTDLWVTLQDTWYQLSPALHQTLVKIDATSCCSTFECSCWSYMILGR